MIKHTSTPTTRRILMIPATIATMALLGTGLGASQSADAVGASTHTAAHAHAAVDLHAKVQSQSEIALYAAMRVLWAQHMEWTYATIAAFAADTNGVTATLDRLLVNQSDIGNALKPYYGDAAGDALTDLLMAHIKGAVPILVAAKAGNTDDLNAAVTAWYANAKAIGDFLADANPAWDRAEMEGMMKTHIDQTLAYATAQLQGDYAASINDYDLAETHMREMADMLSAGIVAQFPKQFRR